MTPPNTVIQLRRTRLAPSYRLPMGKWVRDGLDAFVAGLARLMLRVFFREVEVVGLERIPRGVPLVIVANHVNSLVDPMLLLGFLGARPRVLAKSTLWSHPVVAPLVLLAGAIPVYRRGEADTARNTQIFARAGEALAGGAAIALFPEGGSHNEPHLLPLKTGAARLVLGAAATHGPIGLRIVPVGLVYEAKGGSRSRVVVNVGAVIDPTADAALYASDEARAVRRLTARIAEALGRVVVSYSSS